MSGTNDYRFPSAPPMTGTSNPPLGYPPTTDMSNPPLGYPPVTNTSNPPLGYPPAQPTTGTSNPPLGYPPAQHTTATSNPPLGYPPAQHTTSTSNQPLGYQPAPAMSQPQGPPPGSKVVVISPQFCVSYPVDLTITRKIMTLAEGTFAVTDVQGNVMFKIKGKVFSLHDKRVLLDAAGKPIITFQQKLLTAHRRWQAFRGESTDAKDLLFSLKKSSLLQFKTKLDVILGNNKNDDACDFKIEGSWFERSCVIKDKNSNIIAQMHKKYSAQSILLGKDTFGVTVYPNVDYAFIVALVVILDEINADRSGED